MKNQNYFHRVQAQTPTRYWINNPSQEQAVMAIEEGAVGCTCNPSYLSKMLNDPKERPFIEQRIDTLVKEEADDTRVVEKLQTEMVCRIAELFLPIYEQSNAKQGLVSIQGDPFNENTETILSYGLHNAAQMPNITPKVPIVLDGLIALKELLLEGISINTTEIFAMRQFHEVADVYDEVCSKVSRPPTVFYSHIAGIFDEYLAGYVKDNGIDISPDVLWHAGGAMARRMEQARLERGSHVRMISGGARGLHHFTEMVGAEAQVTINWPGTSDKLLEQNPPVVQQFQRPIPYSVVEELCKKLPPFAACWHDDGLAPEQFLSFGPVVLFHSSFAKGWKAILTEVATRRALLD